MQVPIQITFDAMAPSEAVETAVREHAARLERFHPRLARCRVVVGAPHRHHRKGRLYCVSLELSLPGSRIVVNRERRLDHAHEDVLVAIRDAFDAARRRLEDHARTMRGQVKEHVSPAHGRVVRLFPDEGYGFIAAPDGSEAYFHRNSVLDGFDHLHVGSEVRFVPETAEKGLNASSVRLVGRHHHPVGWEQLA